MEHCLAFAETGHLAISTLHANNANQALDRIINFFPEERRQQLLADIGNNIRAIVSQRLVPTVDGKRCAAIEILLGSHTIKQMIMKGQLDEIKETMFKSENIGMKTFDSALYDLVVAGRVSFDDAIKFADSANNLRLRLKLSGDIETEEEEDPTAMLFGGNSQAEEEEATADTDEESGEDSLEALLSGGIPGASASSTAPAEADLSETDLPASDLPDNVTPLPEQPPAAPGGLSLVMDPEPEDLPPEPGEDDDDDQMGSMGMGRIG